MRPTKWQNILILLLFLMETKAQENSSDLIDEVETRSAPTGIESTSSPDEEKSLQTDAEITTEDAKSKDETSEDTLGSEDMLIFESKLKTDLCCMRNQKCCVDGLKSAKFEVRAIMMHCSKRGGHQYCPRKSPAFIRQEELKRIEGFEHEHDFNQLTNCSKKLALSIKVANQGITTCKNQYVVIDHVYDPLTDKKQRLLYPYVLKIRQSPMMETYRMRLEQTVNYEAKETVLNKHDENYAGCKTEGPNPTCGSLSLDGEQVAFSSGFCCSCDSEKNQKREALFSDLIPNSKTNEYEESFQRNHRLKRRSYDTSLPETDDSKNHFYEDQNYEIIDLADSSNGDTKDQSNEQTLPDPIGVQLKNDEHQQGDLLDQYYDDANQAEPVKIGNVYDRAKDSQDFSFSRSHNMQMSRQSRGGQDCTNMQTPNGMDPDTYHDSAHCLKYSDLWYDVYSLSPPSIEHTMEIEVFEKHTDSKGKTIWRELIKHPITVGTQTASTITRCGVSVSYCNQDKSDASYAIESCNYKLLVPQECPNCEPGQYPPLEGGPEEYLVVPNRLVSKEGAKSCNQAGVGFESFVKQPNRCKNPKGSCLFNQPKDLYMHDHIADKHNIAGSYFLKNFAPVPLNPIKNCSKNVNLTLFNSETHVVQVTMEIEANLNTVLRPHSHAQITEVYTESSNPSKTQITVKVTNSGLVHGAFYVVLSNCPLNTPAGFNNIASQSALIAPQHQHIFHLDVECSLPSSSFYCSVDVLNVNQELVAYRRVRFIRGDRCICIWHCKCACLKSDGGLKCAVLSLDEYNAAGFQGGLSSATHLVQYTALDDLMSVFLMFFLTLCLTLLFLGIVKALVGICVASVGLWGLDVILGLPKPLSKYYEKKLQDRGVVYDDVGWPIDPDTGSKVRNTQMSTEFCCNLLFFYIYPWVLLYTILRKMCCSDFVVETECRCVSTAKWTKYAPQFETRDAVVNRAAICYSGFAPMRIMSTHSRTSESFSGNQT